MNAALWGLQIVLALLFLLAGTLKTTQPIEQLATQMTWVPDLTPWQVRLIGVLEILGAIGLILPALTGIWPGLTGFAAVGLALTMIGAVITHLRRAEWPNIGMNLVILVLAIIIAYGRFVLAPL